MIGNLAKRIDLLLKTAGGLNRPRIVHLSGYGRIQVRGSLEVRVLDTVLGLPFISNPSPMTKGRAQVGHGEPPVALDRIRIVAGTSHRALGHSARASNVIADGRFGNGAGGSHLLTIPTIHGGGDGLTSSLPERGAENTAGVLAVLGSGSYQDRCWDVAPGVGALCPCLQRHRKR